jgi:hypothetical protein
VQTLDQKRQRACEVISAERAVITALAVATWSHPLAAVSITWATNEGKISPTRSLSVLFRITHRPGQLFSYLEDRSIDRVDQYVSLHRIGLVIREDYDVIEDLSIF